MFTDPASTPTAEAEALAAITPERKREMAFDAMFSFAGVPLHPFTPSRQAIVAELMARRIGPTADATDAAFLPEVMATIWICLHQPADWRSFRHQPDIFWEVIEAWADTALPQPQWPEAFLLVFGQRQQCALPATDNCLPIPALPYVMGIKEAARIGMVVRKPDPTDSAAVLPGKPVSPSTSATT